MRGKVDRTQKLFISFDDPENLIPKAHPLRKIKQLASGSSISSLMSKRGTRRRSPRTVSGSRRRACSAGSSRGPLLALSLMVLLAKSTSRSMVR